MLNKDSGSWATEVTIIKSASRACASVSLPTVAVVDTCLQLIIGRSNIHETPRDPLIYTRDLF